jgi:hypothetical protein
VATAPTLDDLSDLVGIVSDHEQLAVIGRNHPQFKRPAPPEVVVVADSGMGYLGTLCDADTAKLRFVVPLRADTGGSSGSAPT